MPCDVIALLKEITLLRIIHSFIPLTVFSVVFNTQAKDLTSGKLEHELEDNKSA